MEFLICVYYKYMVEEIIPIKDEKELKKYLIDNYLQKPKSDRTEKHSIEQIMKVVNERWNVTDGDFWRLVYQLHEGKYVLVYNDE